MKDHLLGIWEVLDADQIAYYEELARQDKWRYIEEWESWLR